MQDLITLTKLLHKVSPDNSLKKSQNNFGKLYSLFVSSEFSREDEYFKEFDSSNFSINAFRVLKSRFYAKLLNILQDLPPSKVSNVPRTSQNLKILDGLKIYNILDSGFSVKDKINYLKILLKKSKKSEDAYLNLIISLNLYEVYSIWDKQSKKEQIYFQDLVKYRKHLDDRILATEVFSKFAKIITTNKNLKEVIIDKVLYNNLISLSKSDTKDYKTKIYIYSSLYYFHLINGDIQKLESTCDEALHYFEKRKTNIAGGYFSFLIKKAYVEMNKSNYTKAYALVTTSPRRDIPRTSLIWLNINIYAIKNLIYLSRYQEAMSTLLDVTRHSSFKKVKTPYFTEIYKIKEAYLNVLKTMGKFSVEDIKLSRKNPFRINKFLNEVPTYSKDKRGSNISILIIHIFYLFIHKKYDLILNRLECLKAYTHRYLRNDDTLRSNAFIKILLKLPAANYHPVALKRHANKFYERMINAPVHLAARHIEVEVIPYEKQYELLSELLEMRQQKLI